MMKTIMTAVMMTVVAVFAQYNSHPERVIPQHEECVPCHIRVGHGRSFKVIGISLIAGGFFLAKAHYEQRVDVPFFVIGACPTIEGIRLTESCKGMGDAY